MSFEGYYQRICDNGHGYFATLYDQGPCPDCSSTMVIAENLVDVTNGCETNDKPCRCGERVFVLNDQHLPIGFGEVVVHKKPAPVQYQQPLQYSLSCKECYGRQINGTTTHKLDCSQR
jgi:hypothetical protein